MNTLGPWRPIGGEPKDGTRILCYRDGDIASAWWHQDPMDEEKKVLGGRGWHYAEFSFPTHWMPEPIGPFDDRKANFEVADIEVGRPNKNNRIYPAEMVNGFVDDLVGMLVTVDCIDTVPVDLSKVVGKVTWAGIASRRIHVDFDVYDTPTYRMFKMLPGKAVLHMVGVGALRRVDESDVMEVHDYKPLHLNLSIREEGNEHIPV